MGGMRLEMENGSATDLNSKDARPRCCSVKLLPSVVSLNKYTTRLAERGAHNAYGNIKKDGKKPQFMILKSSRIRPS
jgi:hypothetical protein